MRKRFTISDVAKLAGVGKVTVSYVLNGRAEAARISKETAERVLAAARELEYRPSAIARSLVNRKANAITLVFQKSGYFSSTSTFISEILRGVSEACVEADVNLILHTRSFTNPVEEAHAIMDGRTDGALVLRDNGDPTIEELVIRGFPTMLFFARPDHNRVSFVDSDNYTGGRLAAEHLLGIGHERIGMIHGNPASVASNDRLAGFRAALTSRGHVLEESRMLRFDAPDHVDLQVVNWIKKHKLTSVVCWSDDVAFECLETLSKNGISVPNDVSFVGFDSSPACERSNPPLTSVRQPIYEIAFTAARKLIAKTRDESEVIEPSIYPLTLDVRESTLAIEPLSSTKRKS